MLELDTERAALGPGESTPQVPPNTRAAPAADPSAREALLKVVCGPGDYAASTLDIVNTLAAAHGCSRVALGVATGDRVRLRALSHCAWFDAKSTAVMALEGAMEEAFDQRATIVLPSTSGTLMSAASRELAAANCACSVILAGGGGLGHGVLYLERPVPGFSPAEVAALAELGELMGPVLDAKLTAQRWVGGAARKAVAASMARLRDPRRPALRCAVAGAMVALAALMTVDVTWNIGADAVIEGEQQRVIPAPFEGFLAAAPVKAGAVVRKGARLAELDTRQLHLDRERWRAEEAQHESRYRDALVRHDRPAAAMALAQMQQAQAQGALADERLAKAVLRAPFDAYVVAGDLSQQLGSPVEQGKVLFELAPLDAYRVVLHVDERDIGAVKAGQRGRLVLSSQPQQPLGLQVTHIAMPDARDGRNLFRVEARLDPGAMPLRPGMQGVARIDAGRRSLWWIWTHPSWQWLSLQLWKWSP